VVATAEHELSETCDVVLAQDAASALVLAERYRATPLVSVAHADDWDTFLPPQLPGAVQAVVVLNDRVQRRIEALAVRPEIVRLRQPVDLKRFAPLTPLNESPQRALLVGNYLHERRRTMLLAACDDLGIECRQIGVLSGPFVPRLEDALKDADIVFGKARVIVEAMAAGRAAYVYDWNGGDGWVTPARYPLLEADNFGGQAETTATDPARLLSDLAAYRPEMGAANRDLAVAGHSATVHAQDLIALFERLAPRPEPVAAPLREMSRLMKLNWLADSARHGLEQHHVDLSERLQRAEQERERARADAAAARAELAALQATPPHRLAQALARPLDRLRRR
jgi:glycosyltransferase involved in cell wall biosynthesis